MERRDFVRNTSFALLASLISKNGMASSLSNLNLKKKITVGAHVWVYASTQPGFDVTPALPQVFPDMKYAGLDGVELMHHPLRDSNTTNLIGELIEKHDLPVIGTSYGANMWDASKYQEILEDAEKIIENLASVDGKTFGTSVGETPGGRLKTKKELDAQAKLLEKLISTTNKNGITLNLHNHTYEIENDLHDLKGILKRIPNAKLGPDLNWLLRGNVDPIWFLNEFKDNIVFLHLRDQLENGKWSESLGEGDVDFTEIGNALAKNNFNGEVIIELAHERNFELTRPLKESLKMSREYIRKTMGY